MNETPLPAWDDRNELLGVMTGDWQPLSQPLTQEQALQLADFVCADLLQYRFAVEIFDAEDASRLLVFNLVASGDYGDYLDPLMSDTAKELVPPNRVVNLTRVLSAIRRTARGARFVLDGCPTSMLELAPPLIRPCDARWENIDNKSVSPPDVAMAEEHAGPKVVEYLGLRLELDRRKLRGNGKDTEAELDPVQTAALHRLLKSGDSWLNRNAIEAAISTAKTRPGQKPYRSEDPILVNRLVTRLRKILIPFGYTIKNDRHSGYRIEAGIGASVRPPRKKAVTRKKAVRKKPES